MSSISGAIVDGLIVGLGVPILGKGHEIAMANRKAHGTMLKIDGEIIKNAALKNPRMTITAGVVAAAVFTGGSWMSRVKSERDALTRNPTSQIVS